MNRLKKSFALAMVTAMLFSLCSCAETTGNSGHVNKNPAPSKPIYESTEPTDGPGSTDTPPPTPTLSYDDYVTDFTFFGGVYGIEKNSDNEIRERIAEITGVRVTEAWLTGQMCQEAIGSIIASGSYPDFINGMEYNIDLYENGALIAWDDYLEEYPNLKALHTDEEWDRFRMDDGHIYWADVFDCFYEKDTTTTHIGSAFWIQVRVLEWAGYPEIETLDQYFDLLERYADANPSMPDGTPVIPYTCITEDWRYYSIESAPAYLDGYPPDGCVIVNVDAGKDKPKVIDYNTTDTAKAYFKKLNEEYNRGYIDKDFAVQTYDEYVAKLATGAVLGMFDQYWDFAYNCDFYFDYTLTAADGSYYNLKDIGCEYVPLGLVAEEGMEQQYYVYGGELNTESGIAVTIGCYDPEKAFRFLNDLLSPEVHDLRFWGIEGVDYLIDEDGLYYRTEEMRANWNDTSYLQAHTCEYSYFPQWKGLCEDGINCRMPSEQPYEFKATLSEPVVKCLDAYKAGNFVEFLGSEECENYPWYPLWSWSNSLSASSDYGAAWEQMYECKHQWLPIVVMSSDFESDWDSYMENYAECDPDIFIDAAQREVEERLASV